MQRHAPIGIVIDLLLPSTAADWAAHLHGVAAAPTLGPFDPVLIEFVDAASKAVLRDASMRSMPEMMAAAHWMRKAHLLELQREFEAQRGDRIRLPRGVVLHFAPSNVDSIFVYSWFISMLLGNGNVIRLSDRRGAQVDVLLGILNRLLTDDRFAPVRERTLLLSYPHDDEVTGTLSEACHVRVLWGGDESISRLRRIPLNPLATEVAFANRFSLAVFESGAVAGADDEQLRALASRFYNDAYWFDQMACSAPRLVVWVGDPDVCRAAQAAFWPALSVEVSRRGVQYPDMVGLNKLVHAYVAAATGLADVVEPGVTGPVSRVHLADRAGDGFRRIECGGGLFFEAERGSLDGVAAMLTQRDQTLSYFGFDRTALAQLARALPTRAIDRIVPVGSALAFGTTWDGNSLFQVFSRDVDLQ